MRYDASAKPHLTKARPDARDLGAVCPLYRPVPLDAGAHFARRDLIIRGLMSGSLDAADAVLLTRPAVELLGLLVPIDGLTEKYLGKRRRGPVVTAGDFESCRRELLAVVAAMLDRWLGEDPALWLAAVARAGSWGATVPGLIESVVGYEDRGQDDRGQDDRIPEHARMNGRAPRWPRGVDASAVLLAMAPPQVVERFLDSCEGSAASRGILTRIVDRGPIVPRLVDYALGGPKSTPAMLTAYFRNPGLLVAALRERVLRNATDVEVLQEAYLDVSADRSLRVGCVRRAAAVGGFQPSFLDRLNCDEDDLRLVEPLLAADDPQEVHRLLKRLNQRLSTPSLRWEAYATLALEAGPEPVWALEQERVGRLEKMAEPVRTSMATGDIAPILAAADAVPLTIGAFGTHMELGAPMIEPWPYTDLIREHVEGNRHRLMATALLRRPGDEYER